MWPFHEDRMHAPPRAWLGGLHILVVVTGAVLAAGARAQADRPPMTLKEAEQLALTDEPGRLALLARADALKDRSVAAAQLPDPMMRMGLANYPIQSGDFTSEPMTQAQLGLRQAFPRGHSRSVRRRQLESLAAEMTQSADGRGRDVQTAVRHAWLETYYWSRAEGIVDDSRSFFTDMVDVTRSLYAVGRKDQQDVLRAELELSRLDDRRIDIAKQLARARAEMAEWVGPENAGRPLSRELPAWTSPPDLETLKKGLASHPSLGAAQARIEARDEGVALARQQYKPGWAVDVGYGYRGGESADGSSRPDFMSVMLTLDVPLFRRNRQDRELAAAQSERRAADASRDELMRRLLSRLESEFHRWQELDRRVDLYQRRVVPQAQENARAALAAYQSEAGDFADVMRGYIDELNTRLDEVRLRVERAQSYAVLANLGGIDQ